jgi:hypothetical protein
MTGKDFCDYIRAKTATNSATFSDAEIVLLANIFKDELATRVVQEVSEKYFEVESLQNLVAAQRAYDWPASLISKINYIEAKLDGTNFIHLLELPLSSYGGSTDEAEIITQFTNTQGEAFWRHYRNKIWIYSGTITSVTNGLRIYAPTFPADILTTTLADDTTDLSANATATSHGVPRQLHRLWATAVIIEFKTSADRGIQLTESELKWENDLQIVFKSMRNVNQDTAFTAPLPSAEDTGNYGADY